MHDRVNHHLRRVHQSTKLIMDAYVLEINKCNELHANLKSQGAPKELLETIKVNIDMMDRAVKALKRDPISALDLVRVLNMASDRLHRRTKRLFVEFMSKET